MLEEKHRAVLLGLAFLILLMLSYFINAVLFNTLSTKFQNPLLVFSIIFINNSMAISLILLGMTFYVDLVILGFFKREKYANVVLEHPRTFAVVFVLIVLFLSILKGTNLFLGRIIVEALPIIFRVSTPIGIIEGYGIYLTIKKSHKQNHDHERLSSYLWNISHCGANRNWLHKRLGIKVTYEKTQKSAPA